MSDYNRKRKELFKRGQFHLTTDEINKLVKACKSLRNRIIIKILAYQGLRRFELAKIKIEEVDLNGRTIEILGKKNIFRISFIFCDDLLEDLKVYIDTILDESREGYLFPAVSSLNVEGHISKTEINRIVAKAGKKACLRNPTPGLKNINPHILRHSCARILKDKGLSLETVQKVLGHLKFGSTMDIYGTKSVFEVRKELVDKAGKAFK